MGCVLDGRLRELVSQDESRIDVSVPYYREIYLQVGRVARKFGLTQIFHPYRKLRDWLCPLKDNGDYILQGFIRSPDLVGWYM